MCKSLFKDTAAMSDDRNHDLNHPGSDGFNGSVQQDGLVGLSVAPATSAVKFVLGSHRVDQFYRPKAFDGTPLDEDLGHLSNHAIEASVAV